MEGFSKVSSQKRPYFFKIFFPQLCGEKLGIPPKFWRHIDCRTHKIVALKGPSGDIWDAELVRDANGLSLQKGWQDFVKDNSVSLSDFLLFRYDGCLQFTIFIFGKNACEKEDAFLASSRQELTILGDSIAKEKTIFNLVDDTCNSPLKCFQHSGSVQMSRKKVTHSSKTESQLPSKSDIKLPASVIKEERIQFSEPSTPTRVKSSPLKNKSRTKRKIAEPKSPLTASGSSTFKGNGLEKKSLRSKERWRKQNYENGQAFVKARMGLLVSNRRPVTEEEVERASKAAKLFTSRNPTALVVMRESYVYSGFYLNLPTYFVREYLPQSSQKLKLWDPCGRIWTVNYVAYLGCGGISARWGAFSLANNLEKDDVCVFELIGKTVMKVHIFRVVEELTPLTSATSVFEELQPLLMLEGAEGGKGGGMVHI